MGNWERSRISCLRGEVIFSGRESRDFAFTATANCPNVPRRLPDPFPSPVFFEVVLSGLPAAAGNKHKQADETVEDSVYEYASYDIMSVILKERYRGRSFLTR